MDKPVTPVVSVSGGKDSTALYLWAMEHYQGDFKAVFADTGNEHEITLDYVRDLPRLTRGPEIQWVKADFTERLGERKKFIADEFTPDRATTVLEAFEQIDICNLGSFLALCVFKGMFPTNMRRFCSSELKHVPIYDQAISPLLDSGVDVLSLQGIRADESASRANAKEYEQIDEGVTVFRPMLHWTVEDVFSMHKRHGVEPNALYSMGMSRVGCFPCIMSRKSEIAQIVKRFPEHIEKIKRWENWVQRSSKTGLTTFFPATKVPGTIDMRSNIDNVVAWATGTTPGQMPLPFEMPAFTCVSQYGLCE